ncbi:amino acid ABC transporter substrate-binding protein [Streptomyces sp. NPDC091972]|uniref:amino acid ABC transporter substrate-binding protein n=1 Tax=Streptomyces sp. NPDC091972 TaxID=3366007 RepID=UPI003825B8BF
MRSLSRPLAVRRGTQLACAGAALALAATGCSSTSTHSTSGPITIGMSLPLSGAIADISKDGYRGYQEWADELNAHGGLLGRKVKLVVLDDAFQQNTALADYNKLIAQNHVDLLLGTFSSFLNLPVAQVAERNKYVYIEPSGGADSIFARNFKYLFFAQPATTERLPDQFVAQIAALPASQRPKTAAFVTQDDPNTSPATALFKKKLAALGVKSVYNTTYAPDTSNFDAIANSIKQASPDLVVQGALADDGVSLVRAFQKVSFSPKMLFQTNSPSDPKFPSAIGTKNAEGIFTALAYSPEAPFPGNAKFVADYTKRFGEAPSEDAANSYTAGQVLQAGVTAAGKIDQTAIAQWLHAHTVQTIVGPLSWTASGKPTGSLLLAQWQSGKLQIVAPSSAATAKKAVLTKPGWSN